MLRFSKVSLLLGLFVSQPSCEPDRNPEEQVQRWDSGGVLIVESHHPIWTPESAWRVSDEAQLLLGENSDDPSFQFIHVTGARITADSMIVVADRGSAEVRFYSRQGQFQGVVGGRGDGPGDFQDIQGLGEAGGDTIWAFDRARQRITLMTLPDDPVRVIRQEPPARTELGGRLPDGGWVFVHLFSLDDLNPEEEPGVYRDTGALVHHGPNGLLEDTIASVPTQDIVHMVEDGTMRRWRPPVIGWNLTLAMGGAGFFIGTQERFEIGEYDPEGQLLRLIRLPDADLTLPAEVLQQALDRGVRNADEGSRYQERALLADLPRRNTLPAYARFLVDDPGNLWVCTRDFSAPGRMRCGPDWYVFDPSGSWLGTVAMPADFEPTYIGEVGVLGVHTDGLDVQRVRLHRLIK